MRSRLVAVSTLCTVLMFVSLQLIWAEERKDAKSLFESKCATCHSIEGPKSKTKTKEEWEQTVMRMKNVNMAPISDQEARTIIDYLARHYGK